MPSTAAPTPAPSAAMTRAASPVGVARRRSRSAAQPAVSSRTTAPTIRNCGCISPPPASRIAAPIVPRRERRASATAAAMNGAAIARFAAYPSPRWVAHTPARSPPATQAPRGSAPPRRPRTSAAPAVPDRRAPPRTHAGERRDEPDAQRAGDRGQERDDPGAFADRREAAIGRHPRPPQVHGDVRTDGEHVAVAERRPHEQGEQHEGDAGDECDIDRGPAPALGRPVPRRSHRRHRARRYRPPAGLARPTFHRAAVSIAPMLDPDLLADVLRTARRKGGDVAEVFVEERSSTSVRLDDGKVEELTTGLDRGAGVRVTQGTSYGYAFSNRLDRDLAARSGRGRERGAPRRRGRTRRRPHRRARARAATAPSGRPATSRPPRRSAGSARWTTPHAASRPR